MQGVAEGQSLTPINLHILKVGKFTTKIFAFSADRFVNLLQILTLAIQNLWLPDVEILDLKAFETHSVLSKLEGGKYLLKTHSSVKTEKF